MNKALSIIKNERGDILGLGTFVGIFFAVIILFAAIDVYGMIVTYDKLKLAGEDTLELMKAKNVLDKNLEKRFYELVKKLELKEDKVKIGSDTTRNVVQRGEIVEFHASTTYDFIAINPFGKQISSELKIKLSGLARTYVRK